MSSILTNKLLEDEIRVFITFKNLTSQTSFDGDIKITGFSNNGCTLILPRKTCSDGHQIHLDFYLNVDRRFRSKENRTEIIGKISETIPVDSDLIEAIIVFNQFRKSEWQTILDCFEKKQEETSEVIRKLKLI